MYAQSDQESRLLRKEYCYYITQHAPFDALDPIWEHANDPAVFWLMASILTQVLGKLALRVIKAPCNSVPSERAFSVQNLIHSKTRNQLQSIKVNKLMRIYVNSCVLSQIPRFSSSSFSNATTRLPTWLTEEELVQMEEELLNKEDESDLESVDEDMDVN